MDNSRHKESFFLWMDIGPIIAAWSLGMVLFIWLVMIPCCRHYVCRSKDGDFPEEPENVCKCYCQDCGRKTCDANCACHGSIRSEHVEPKCEYCQKQPQNENNETWKYWICDCCKCCIISFACCMVCLCLRKLFSRSNTPTNGAADDCCTTCSKDCCTKCCTDCCTKCKDCCTKCCTDCCTKCKDCCTKCSTDCCTKCCICCCYPFDTNRLLRAGNVLVRMFYGGNLGPLRESQKLPIVDRRGREVAYINDVPIIERAFLLHLTLTLKSILLTVFCLSTFVDALLVDVSTVCDFEKHCFFVNNDYFEDPLENCTLEVAKYNNTVSVICYELALDYKKAAGYAGGLYTISRLSVTITGNMSIKLYQYLKNKRCLFNTSILLQYVLSTFILSGFIALVHASLYNWSKSPGPPIAQASTWLDYLCIILIVALSVATPWHLAVKPWDKDWTCCLCSCSRECVSKCKSFWCCLCLRCSQPQQTQDTEAPRETEAEEQSLTLSNSHKSYGSGDQTVEMGATPQSPNNRKLSYVA